MNGFPWPEAFASAGSWHGVSTLLGRLAALANRDALPATLMLLGEPGLGREAAAIELAAALACRDGGHPGCGCGACARVRRGVHPDVEVLAPLPGKSEITRDQAHLVIDRILQRPFEARRRVFIVSSCHNPPLNEVAGSALLKTLEEPPPHAVFILLAGNPARVLPTILSRAVAVRVPTPERTELGSLLAALHDVDLSAATDLAAFGELAIAGGTALPATVGAQRARLAAALGGDALALLQLGADAGDASDTASSVLALLDLLAGDAGGAEGILTAASALLVAERRCLSLHTDLESGVIGALAPLVRVPVSR